MKDINTIAYSLIAGGWTPEDIEDIQAEHDLTDDEASEIYEEMLRVLED